MSDRRIPLPRCRQLSDCPLPNRLTRQSRRAAATLAALTTLGTATIAATAAADPPNSLTVTSAAMPDGSTITHDQLSLLCLGGDRSPDLTWSAGPAGTRSYAIIMIDPDAPTGPAWHWVAFDIAPEVTALPEGLPRQTPIAKQAESPFLPVTGYEGPCAPPGPQHHYTVTVHALDVPSLGLPDGGDNATARAAINAHTIATGSLTALFSISN